MKILVINGSPKGDKSDTWCMTKAFLQGMKEVSDHEIKYINVMEKHIEYCQGDLSRMRNGGKCIWRDDMEEILEDILESKLVIFSFPLYGFGIPAPLKALLDRTLPVASLAMRKSGEGYEHVEQADLSHLQYVVISGCGFPNAKHNFEALRLQFKLRFGDKVFMLTVPEAPMFHAPEADSVTKPFLRLVQQAGKEYAKFNYVPDELMEKLSVPMIDEEIYAAICNHNV